MIKSKSIWGGIFTAIISLGLLSCNGDNSFNFKPETYRVEGKVEKGPFVSGSTITIQLLDDKLQTIGEMYSSTIQDNEGNFSFGEKVLKSPYAELMASGYFYNEVEGELSEGTINLRGIADLSDATTVNVNIITHLKYSRVQNLVAAGKDFPTANKQAQKELFDLFGLGRYADTDAAGFSITAGNDEAAVLIAISSLLLAERSEAEFTEYLSRLSREFGANGMFSETTRQQIARDRHSIADDLEEIRRNIITRYEELGKSVTVKELIGFFDWNDDGIAGNEQMPENGEVTLETDELNIPYNGGVFKIAVTSPIPLTFDPYGDNNIDAPSIELMASLYEGVSSADWGMKYTRTIEVNTITINVEPRKMRGDVTETLYLYDYTANVVATITLHQEGNSSAEVACPALSHEGEAIVGGMAISLARSLAYMNMIEQLYHYNKEAQLVDNITADNGNIRECWQLFYKTVSQNAMIREADQKQLCAYQDYFAVFNALAYYNMTMLWGGVPYYDMLPVDPAQALPATPADEILDVLTLQLTTAIDRLDEKKNESLGSIPGFFFVSRDVARVLLADIYMYRGRYEEAFRLLQRVVEGGFYTLDDSNYSIKETIDNLRNNPNEVIFATVSDNGIITRANITIQIPPLVPVMTYTEVYLSYAECLYKTGREGEAVRYVDELLAAKHIAVAGDEPIARIADARKQLLLYGLGNFAFMKRNNLGAEMYGIDDFRMLLPIPLSVLSINSMMGQNPGY